MPYLLFLVLIYKAALANEMPSSESLEKIIEESKTSQAFYRKEIKELLKPQNQSCSSCQNKSFLSEALRETSSQPENKTQPELLIFVSSSMPSAALTSLFQQVHLVGGRLIFQGLIGNSFAQTKAFFEKHQFNADIDPQLFTDHQIKHVPTFVLKKEEKADQVEGNISVFEALDIIHRKGELKKHASLLLQKRGEKE